MGKHAIARRSIGSVLFNPTQERLLTLLFVDPDRSFGGGELIRLVGRGSGAAQRQMAALVEAGLVTVTSVGNQRRYQADRRSPIFPELRGLILKTAGLAGPLRDALMTRADDIAAAFVFGSVAGGTAGATSDLDLLVMTRHRDALSHGELYELLMPAERALGRRVEPVLITEQDWTVKRRKRDSFISRIAKGPRVMILGADDALG